MDRSKFGSSQGSKPVITILPVGKIYFGIVSNGFIYRLSFQVQNNLLDPIKIRVINEKLDESEPNTLKLLEMPEKIAPGMVLTLKLELTADYVITSLFQLTITQDVNDSVVTKLVEANVVSIDTFKHVKKSLQLNKRPVYRKNVEVVGNTPEFEDKMTASMINSISSNTSLVMMDSDEIEDMMDFPSAENVYWDPFDKCLRIDPALGKVFADGNMKQKKVLRKTATINAKRLKELEEQGFFTCNTMRAVCGEKGRTMFDDDDDDTQQSDQQPQHQQLPTDTLVGLEEGSETSSTTKVVAVAGTNKVQEDDEEQDSDDEGDLLSELIKMGEKEGVRHKGKGGGSGSTASTSSSQSEIDGLEGGEEASHTPSNELMDGICRMSVTGILAMKRSKRERIERQRRQSIQESVDFSKISATDSMVDSSRTINMINSRIKGVQKLSIENAVK